MEYESDSDDATQRRGLRRRVRQAALAVLALLATATGTAAAQPSGGEIIGAFCDNALFSALIDAAFALLFVFLLIIGLIQVITAAKDANNPNKKGEGEEKAKNGGTTLFGAALVPTAYIFLGLILPDCFTLTGAGIGALGGGAGMLVPTSAIKAAVLGVLVPTNAKLVAYGGPSRESTTGEATETETTTTSTDTTTSDDRE